MPSYQNASSKRHPHPGTNHRPAERAIDSVLHPGAEPVAHDVFGDPTRLAAHEIRSHLGLLTGYLSLLQEGALGGLPDGVRPVLEEMDAKTRAISRLVDDMLEDARFQDGRLHLTLQFVDVSDVVATAAEERRATLSPAHRLDVHLPPVGVVAEIDPGRVLTILRNLLDNAVKYSPDGPELLVRLQPKARGVLLEVSDRGIGLPPAAADRIFDAFSRASNAEERQITGMGLGLYICRNIVEQHHGRIWARSEGEGTGTTMCVWLPEPHAAASARAA